MSNAVVYPFAFDKISSTTGNIGEVRGRVPSAQASKIRAMVNEAHNDPSKTVAMACTYDGLSSRMVEEAGFPLVFASGYPVASSMGLPDTGYIAMQDMCVKIQEIARQVSVPILVDGDTGYGSPMNVRYTVECFAKAGAAGIMIEDQQWPKRCGHTQDKSVVSRGESYARIKAACDARNEGVDIFILARTDSLILGYDEAITRAREFIRLGVDAIFIEAVRDVETMKKTIADLQFPLCSNIIEGGKTPNLPANELSKMGYAMVGYPITLAAAHIRGLREALNGLKKSMTIDSPPVIMDFPEVCEAVGFNKYWTLEKRYKHTEDSLIE